MAILEKGDPRLKINFLPEFHILGFSEASDQIFVFLSMSFLSVENLFFSKNGIKSTKIQLQSFIITPRILFSALQKIIDNKS